MKTLLAPNVNSVVPDDAMCAWLPGGRALVMSRGRAPYVIEQDGKEREVDPRDAAQMLTDPRTMIIPGPGSA